MKVGDLVTVDLGQYSNSSNTYKIEGFDKGRKRIFLSHPIVDDELFIAIEEDKVNEVQAKMKNATEVCLDFGKKHKNLLGYKLQAELDALCLYFFVKKVLTPNQKEVLASICSKVASILLKSDLKQGVDLVNNNLYLLDDFNKILYNNIKPMFEDVSQIKNNNKRLLVQKIIGFVMAQLESENK